MSIPAKPKKFLEHALKGALATGTSATEANIAALSLGVAANDVETGTGVSSRAAELARELQTAQTQTKREEIARQLATFATNNI